MRILLASVLLAAATVSSPGPAIAKSVSAVFSDTWEQRQAKYTAEYASDQGRFNSAASSMSKALDAGDSNFGPALDELIRVSTAMGYADGRLGTIKSLRMLMAEKPKQLAIELWLQDQADTLKRASADLSAQIQATAAQQPRENGATANTQLQTMTLRYILIGQINGRIDELLLDRANLSSFLSAKNAERQRRRAAVDAVSQGLSDYSQRLLSLKPPPAWSATCSTTGGFTRCTGH